MSSGRGNASIPKIVTAMILPYIALSLNNIMGNEPVSFCFFCLTSAQGRCKEVTSQRKQMKKEKCLSQVRTAFPFPDFRCACSRFSLDRSGFGLGWAERTGLSQGPAPPADAGSGRHITPPLFSKKNTHQPSRNATSIRTQMR